MRMRKTTQPMHEPTMRPSLRVRKEPVAAPVGSPPSSVRTSAQREVCESTSCSALALRPCAPGAGGSPSLWKTFFFPMNLPARHFLL